MPVNERFEPCIHAIAAAVGDVTTVQVQRGDIIVHVPKRDAIVKVITALRDDPKCQFSQLIDITAVEDSPKAECYAKNYVASCQNRTTS